MSYSDIEDATRSETSDTRRLRPAARGDETESKSSMAAGGRTTHQTDEDRSHNQAVLALPASSAASASSAATADEPEYAVADPVEWDIASHDRPRFPESVLDDELVRALSSDTWAPSVAVLRGLVARAFFRDAAADADALAMDSHELAVHLHETELKAARIVNAREDVGTGAKGTFMRLRVPDDLRPIDAARLLARDHRFIYLSPAEDPTNAEVGRAAQPLMVYQDAGPDVGLYRPVSVCDLHLMLSEQDRSATLAQAREVLGAMRALRTAVPSRVRQAGGTLVAFSNGVFDTADPGAGIQEFRPDMVLLSKAYVRLPDHSVPVERTSVDDVTGETMQWDVLSWFGTLVDPSNVNFLLQVLRCAIDPVKADSALRMMVVATGSGRNGTSTFSQILRSFCGETTTASISLTDFGQPFGVETVLGKHAIICDDNDSDVSFKSSGVWKSIADHRPFEVKRKGLPSLSFRFAGLTWQNLNGDFRSSDKSPAFRRRVAQFEFPHDFTRVQRSDIEDFVNDPEVLSSLAAYLMYELEDFDVVKPSAKMARA